jgi:hypothetical protein
VGRAKGFIVAKGDDTRLPTPEKNIYVNHFSKLYFFTALKTAFSFCNLCSRNFSMFKYNSESTYQKRTICKLKSS